MKIAVLTSGGDSQGMNAAIRAVVRTSIFLKHEAYFVYSGFKGLVDGEIKKAERRDVSSILKNGGTILGSARLPGFSENKKLREKAVKNLKSHGIDALVVIGGDGSYMGAMALHKLGIKVVCIPGTIDNDINSTDYTIGFDTAANICVEAIDRIRDTSSSHNRCSIVEVMGRECGDIAMYAGVATGAEIIITSESKITDEEVASMVIEEMNISSKGHVIIVITEHLKNTSEFAKKIKKLTGVETRHTVLGHTQRGGSPSMFDRILASRLGAAAVNNILEGSSGNCVGIINQKIIATNIIDSHKMTKSTNDADLRNLRGTLR